MRPHSAELPLFDYAVHQEALAAPGDPVTTGLASVDQLLGGGLTRGVATLLAARPRMGASSFLLGATLAALKQNVVVAYLSERVPERTLRGRLVLLESRVNGFRLKAFVSPEDSAALAAARERILWQHLSLCAAPQISLDDVASHLARYRPGLAIADLSLGSQVWQGAQTLQKLAARYGVALVWRVILPRALVPPRQAELWGQGRITQLFDSALLLHREDTVAPGDDQPYALGLAELLRLRHRGADTAPDRVQLRFDQRFAGLSDIDPIP